MMHLIVQYHLQKISGNAQLTVIASAMLTEFYPRDRGGKWGCRYVEVKALTDFSYYYLHTVVPK